MKIVSEHLANMIDKQICDNGIVVCYDHYCVYKDAVDTLNLSNTTVLRYEGSFIRLRGEIDQKKLMDGEDPPRILIYVPMA